MTISAASQYAERCLVEATPAIVGESEMGSCLKILCLQTPKYDDGRPGSGVRVRASESRNLGNRNSEINLSNGSIRQPSCMLCHY